jgi:hypothetical protein
MPAVLLVLAHDVATSSGSGCPARGGSNYVPLLSSGFWPPYPPVLFTAMGAIVVVAALEVRHVVLHPGSPPSPAAAGR